MSRVRRREGGEGGHEAEAAGWMSMTITAEESGELRRAVERAKQKVVDALEDAPELKLASLLDSMGCGDEDVADLMKLESGDEQMFGEQRFRELMQMRSRVQTHSADVARGMMERQTENLKVDEALFVDVLVQCAISGRQAWLRFMYRGVDGVSDNERGSLLGALVAVGNSLVVTNLKCIRSASSLPVLLASSSSSITLVDASYPALQREDCGGVLRLNRLRDIYSSVCQLAGEGAASATSDDCASSLTGREVSFRCSIVDWFQTQNNCGTQVEVVILGIDDSRTCVAISYAFPPEIEQRLGWLAKGTRISVSCALVQQLDVGHDILRVTRCDHTAVSAISSSGVPLPSSAKTASSCKARNIATPAGDAAAKKGVRGGGGIVLSSKKRGFALVSPSAFTTPRKKMVAALSTEQQLVNLPVVTPGHCCDQSGEEVKEVSVSVCENERRRYIALRNNAYCFEPLSERGQAMLERCTRQYLIRAQVSKIAGKHTYAAVGSSELTAAEHTAADVWVKVMDTSTGESIAAAVEDAVEMPDMAAGVPLQCDVLLGHFCSMAESCASAVHTSEHIFVPKVLWIAKRHQ